MQLAEHKMKIAERWINLQITGEKLRNMRRARNSFEAECRRLKAEMRKAKKENVWWQERLDAMEELVFPDEILMNQVSAAWRGMFAIIKKLPLGVQKKISQLSVTRVPPLGTSDTGDRMEEMAWRPNPGPIRGVAATLQRPRSKKVVAWMRFFQKRQFVPVDGTDFHQDVFRIMEIIDEAAAIKGAQQLARSHAARSELRALQQQDWKKQQIV
jgi:hypothetical protein